MYVDNFKKSAGFTKEVLVFLLEIMFPRDFNIESLDKILQTVHFTKKFLTIYYFFDYKNKIIKDSIWQLKFKNNKKVAILFGEILSQKIDEIIYSKKMNGSFMLIPVPIHKKRRVERGYNQCEWLCESVVNSMKKNTPTKKINYEPKIIERIKYTEKQSWNGKNKRMSQLKKAFRVTDLIKIKNKKIILIDDVTTTGSTIKEIHQTLLESGASLVISITIAH